MLDYVFEIKGEARKINNKIETKNNLYLIAHKGSGFVWYVVFSLLPQKRTVLSLIKNGAGIVSLKTFNGYIDQNKKISIRSF